MARKHPPAGTVTFLFTDIESSTWLLQHLGDAYDDVLHEHNRIMRETWDAHDGYEVSTEGDAFFVTFDDPAKAVAAALQAQRGIATHVWPDGSPVRVRMGIHTGEARVYDGDYVGLAVHQAARVASAAHGEQVIATEATQRLVPGDAFIDLGLHRLKDLAQPVRLFQLAHNELRMDFPPPRTLSVMPNNFPLQPTTFVGREDDIVQLRACLGESRLVTLTGAGGVGKTRLALQTAADLLDEFPDGAWLVDLAPLSDPEAVAGAAADVLGVREQPGRDLVDTIVDHLLPKRLLIVLDNCEHVIDASAKVVHRILSACPDVTVLATSREALNVSGEIAMRLRSLGVPEIADQPDVSVLVHTESVRLFVQRARTARPDFDLTPENSSAVAQVCRRLDGLPLAIELAAARARTMSVREIAERLDDRFKLLTGGARLALPRQRTLEAAVSWSYDLLSDPERLLFDRLSVFAGGATLEAAERVCSDEDLAAFDIVDLMCQLADRSLIVAEESADGRTRYRLLETLRQFGRERLLQRGDIGRMRDRHLGWCVELTAHMPPQMDAHQPPEVQAEIDNFRAGVEWALETGDHASGLRIIAYVWFGHFDERLRWYEQMIPSVDVLPADARGTALTASGGLAFMMGDWTRGVEHFSKGVQATAEAGDHARQSFCLTYEGACRWGLGEDDAALRLMEDGLKHARDHGEVEAARRAMLALAWRCTEGDLERAETFATELDAQSRESGTPFEKGHAREVLGYVHCLKQDYERGGVVLAEALRLFENIQRNCAAHAFDSAAAWAAMTRRFELGAELLGAAHRIRNETGDKPRPWERVVRETWLPKIRDGLEAANFDAAFSRGKAMRFEEAVAHGERALRSLASEVTK